MTAAIHGHCDAAIAKASVADPAAKYPLLILTTTILASSLDFIDGSVLNVGLPAIASGLGVGGANLPWVLNIYLLPLSALLLIGGAAGDRFGRWRLLMIGSAIFALASAGCAASPDVFWFLTSRALQGVGAAIVLPNSLAILGASFSGARKGQVIGIWAAASAVAGAAGPVLGGWLIDTVGWRAIFLINLPVAAAAIALAWFLANDPADDSPAPLDLTGAALVASGLAALTWGLTSGAGGWSEASGAALGGGILLLLLFVAVERRRRDRAMMPLALFSSNMFVGLTLLTLLLYGALGLLFVLVPFVLIEAAGYSAIEAGAAILPLPLVIAAVSPLIGRLAGRIGARRPLIVGPLVVAIGFLLMARSAPGAGYWTGVFPSVLLIALGVATAVAPLTTAVLGSVDGSHTGSASGLNSAVAQIGGLIATALLGGVLATQGVALVAHFHTALMVAAAAAGGAALSAVLLVARER